MSSALKPERDKNLFGGNIVFSGVECFNKIMQFYVVFVLKLHSNIMHAFTEFT